MSRCLNRQNERSSMSAFSPDSQELHPLDEGYSPTETLHGTAEEIAEIIQQTDFPCIGAQQVFKNGRVFIAEYKSMEDPETAQAIYNDLLTYAQTTNIRTLKDGNKLKYATFLSSFPKEVLNSQLETSEKLYILLKNIIEIDTKNSDVAEGYSRNPSDRNFAMSVDGVPYFTAFFHPLNGNNPRKTEKAIALNWNTHYVFDLLKRKGDHPKWESTIKGRIKAKHGEIHQDLVLNGSASELLQYNLVDGEERNQLPSIIARVFSTPADSHLLLDKDVFRNEAHTRESAIRDSWFKK